MSKREVFDPAIHAGVLVFEDHDVLMNKVGENHDLMMDWYASLKIWTVTEVAQLVQQPNLSEDDLNRLAGLKAGLVLLNVEPISTVREFITNKRKVTGESALPADFTF